ncbi:metallophosphoesterase [Oceanicoccus sagamiensis]|uniref:Serine/threonine protein phosphatase n=1 Tax=Oceanicoccus sagamiensis TaxID=716816 RepID=A0A1X9NJB6_9GAMM|nr:metallophosphoesterase [Oceanicoccus sagamiensis]ARN75945.1 serine/threonine protein phosphatase [Oceanicoccus sagamiensis]
MTAVSDQESNGSAFAGYDLIGDVHGCGDSLVELIEKLGYSKRNGSYEYSNQRQPRQLVFLGDILDRGPKIRESIHIIREMVDRGSAQIVMGNHEYNALGYTTLAPEGSGKDYLREHNANHTRLIQETLDQFANHPQDWRDTLAWLYEWPLFLEFEAFRVIHACWDQPLIDQFKQHRPDGTIDKDFLIASEDFRVFEGRFMSRATRGASLLLPDNLSMTGKDGYTRRTFRVKFWVENPACYGDVQFQPDPLDQALAERRLSDMEKTYIPYYPHNQRPLFIGHYWQTGTPKPLVDNIACLDYSAVKNGRLMAYRMNNEQTLRADNFVWVRGQETLVL